MPMPLLGNPAALQTQATCKCNSVAFKQTVVVSVLGPWGFPRLPSIGSVAGYAIKTWAFLVKRCFSIILIGVISTFELISLDPRLSDCIDTATVGFGRAPVRCSSPCFQLKQSVSTVLQESTAAYPGIAGHPGQPPATWYLHVSYKTSLVVPTGASHAWFPNPALHG